MTRLHQNPWQVESLDDFTFICCPECTFKSKTESSFQNHALDNHPQCLAFFSENLESHGLDNENIDIKEEPLISIPEELPSHSIDNQSQCEVAFENDPLLDEDDNLSITSKQDPMICDSELKGDKKEHEIVDETIAKIENKQLPQEQPNKKSSHRLCKSKGPVAKQVNSNRDPPCEICGLKLNTRAEKMAHWFKKHTNLAKEYLCCNPDCDKTFKDYSELRNHITRNHNFILCDECGKSFRKSNLAKHVETAHADKNNLKYICDVCPFSTYAKKYLWRHLRTHNISLKALRVNKRKPTPEHRKRNTPCEYCGAKFDTVMEKMAHWKLTHVDSKGHYLCSHCPRTFVECIDLRQHLYVAKKNKEKKICPICNKEFLGKHLKRHISNIHGDK